tara:strand:+ start:846 stop:1313 length:468 start_codon:yes stop_codon:yes gene_type:complete
MSGEYKQFKLTNGEEMVCELVASGDEDSTADVIIRRCMKIVVTDDLEDNVRYYTLKPWMSFMDDTQELVALNSVHIVGECKPSETIMIHYAAALADADKYNKVRQAGLSLKEIEEKLKELSDEEMDAFISAKFDEIEKDSDTANIIQFKPKGTLH